MGGPAVGGTEGTALGGPVAALPDPWRSHPFLVEDATHWTPARTWASPAAALLEVHPRTGGVAVVGLGAPEVLAAWLAALAARPGRPRPTRASLTRGTWALLAPRARAEFGLVPYSEWDWLVCDTPPGPPGPEEEQVTRLGPGSRAEVAAALAAANPVTRARPDDPAAQWWGWRDGTGTLRGVVGVWRTGPGGPRHLGGIGTDPAWRGRGIASAVTAAVLRACLSEAPWVSLRMRAENDAARRVYSRLGFRVVATLETVRAPGA